MVLDRARRLWTSLLFVCVPTALALAVWAFCEGGRPLAGELALVYLVVVVAGRAHAASKAQRAEPERLRRVRGQVERVQSVLPSDSPNSLDPAA